MKLRLATVFAVSLCACQSAEHESEAPSVPSSALLAPALRRLSAVELEAAASAVVGAPVALSAALPPDARQADFSRNLAQTLDSQSASQLYDATRATAEQLDFAQAPFPSCAAHAAATDSACQRELVSALSVRAFRRAATEAELSRLLALFSAGAETGSFRDGAVLVARALLGAPQFLYETHLGDAAASAGRVRLSEDELASSLAFLISGAPPDDELLTAARSGKLSNPDERRAQAARLVGKPNSTALFQRFIGEWLGLVRLPGLAKDSSVTQDFAPLSAAMQLETQSFVDDVLHSSGGSLQMLFAGGFSRVPDALAPLYGIRAPGLAQRVSLRAVSRVGILQHGSFLSVFAHEAESAPVLRGKAVLTRLLCRTVPAPQELGIDVVPPAPDPNATTRKRFERHVSDPLCATCHASLDPVGFAFENFDAIGRLRTAEVGQPIDTRGSVLLDGATLSVADSVALSEAIAQSSDLRSCAARQVLRFAAGKPDPAAEDAFVAEVAILPVEWRDSLLGLFLQFVSSDLFAWRKAE